MLNDRKFVIKDENLNMDFEDFKKEYSVNQKLSDIVSKKYDTNELIFVFFNEKNEKLKARDISIYVNECVSKNVKHAIVVSKLPFTNLINEISLDISDDFHLELFLETELMINVTKHELVPKHEVLTAEEKQELLNRYKIEDKLLPRILSTDPISKF
mmetsp:Transcript_59090/g.50057  ORF Transcript_59090/g.50057 Transcript_59090/m.50057 type:complete len:157 (+) Transcript_59090:388-858(+)